MSKVSVSVDDLEKLIGQRTASTKAEAAKAVYVGTKAMDLPSIYHSMIPATENPQLLEAGEQAARERFRKDIKQQALGMSVHQTLSAVNDPNRSDAVDSAIASIDQAAQAQAAESEADPQMSGEERAIRDAFLSPADAKIMAGLKSSIPARKSAPDYVPQMVSRQVRTPKPGGMQAINYSGLSTNQKIALGSSQSRPARPPGGAPRRPAA